MVVVRMPKFFNLQDVESAIPEYTFIEHIDSGGFKDVFLAKRDEETVVVKLLPIDRASRKRRARREAEAMVEISSQNFVNLLDYFEVEIGGVQAFLLEEEYIDGPTLGEKIQSGHHGLDLGFQVAETLIDLLLEFDELNIIHRDIKPANIMFNSNGEMILLDIGIVRFEERDSITPDYADRLGTPNYGAPEQLDYQKELQSIRTDIFSTGIVIYESFTGKHPYANNQQSISEAIMEGNKSGFQGLLPDDELAEELDDMFDIMTETKPHHRYRKPEFVKERFNEIKEMRN